MRYYEHIRYTLSADGGERLMDITFVNPGADYMIRSIMLFQTEGEAEFWHEPLYHFYPQLDRVYAASLPFAERKTISSAR